MMTAVSSFIKAGERQSQASNDQTYISQLADASESLSVASDHLLILAQRYESGTAPDSIRQALCQAAKDILHGILKVLLIMDDHYVQHLVGKTDSVQSMIEGIDKVDKTNLVQTFKAITFAVLALKMELRKRCENLLSKACRDQLMVWTGVVQNSVPSLSKAAQTFLKYPDNISAKASRDSVQQEILDACRKIKQLLCSGPQEEVDDNIINFVVQVDKVMDSLSEVNRGTLNADVESDLVCVVQHSMCVAHFARGVYREMIVAACHRILQAKFRLLELHAALKENPSQEQMRYDFECTCEILLDEVCDLEKHVNMTLLQLIIETFLCPLQEADKLRSLVRHKNQELQNFDNLKIYTQDFSNVTENLCQVALLVAASSTDNTKITEIVTSVKVLEMTDPEIAPAVVLLARDAKHRAASKRHLDLMLDRWEKEVQTIISAVDTMVDPRVFMDMSETMLSEETATFVDVYGCPHERLQYHFDRFQHLATRPTVLARQLMEENSDPIYRNGLNVFITTLSDRIQDAKVVCLEVLQTKHPSTVQLDTVERRMKLVQQALRELRAGLDVQKHPHLLSKKRMLCKQRSVDSIQENLKQKKEQAEAKAKTNKAKKKTAQHDKETNTSEETPAVAAAAQLTETTVDQTKKAEIPLLEPVKPTDVEMGQENKISFSDIMDEKEFEGGTGTEIYQLVKKLLAASASQDVKTTEDLTHSILSWTNHIVENAELLTTHCSQIVKESELKILLREVDKVAPEVIQRAKFVVSGDKLAVYDLLTQAVEWAKKLNRARIILDVAADRWLVLTSDLRRTVEQNREHSLKIMMSALVNAQRDMCQLLLKTRFLTGKYLEDGRSKIDFLTDSHKEIENLAITVQTSVDVAVVSTTRTASDWWQLGMACRDWSVLMTCVMAELDRISDHMETLGRQRFLGLQTKHAKSELRIADILEEETNNILELIDCIVVGDSTLKAICDEHVQELQTALSEILSVAKQPVSASDTPLHGLFCRLRIGLARSRWLEKALDVQDMIRHNCSEYMGFPRQCLLKAQDVAAVENLSEDARIQERQKLSGHFLERSQDLKQKVLRAIQLCPDLSRRAVVRSTLDTLAKLTTHMETVIRSSPVLTDADVGCLSEQWAARMKKLIYNLRKMEDIRPALISDIENLNRPQPGFYQFPPVSRPGQSYSTFHQQLSHPSPLYQHLPHQQHQHTQLQQHQQQYVQSQPQQPDELSGGGSQQSAAQQQQQQQPDSQHQQHLQLELEQQNGQRPLQSPSVHRSPVTKLSIASSQSAFMPVTPASKVDVHGDAPVSSSPHGNQAQTVLDDAQFLNFKLQKWQNIGNYAESSTIKLAMETAQLCSNIALFTKGMGPLNNSQEVIDAAVKIVKEGQELERFARRLLTFVHDIRLTDNLNVCITRMNTCASQLHIISTALHNSAKSYQGDHILMRNTLNLLTAVRQMFSVMESIATKGVVEPVSSDGMTTEISELLAKLRMDNDRYLKDQRQTNPVDELGLRRVELHDPPSLSSLVDVRQFNQSDSREDV